MLPPEYSASSSQRLCGYCSQHLRNQRIMPVESFALRAQFRLQIQLQRRAVVARHRQVLHIALAQLLQPQIATAA